MHILENILLSEYTTIHLGGPARYFARCTSVVEINEAFEFANSRGLAIHIIGGGSNTIFSDSGFQGIVCKIELSGFSSIEEGDDLLLQTQAGEPWDRVVQWSVDHDAAGIECLSGIPGCTGATPIQNVGAYGQEVSDTIESVTALDITTWKERIFRKEECEFGYRTSLFKKMGSMRYIITAVEFRLRRGGAPTTKYPDVQRLIESAGNASLEKVRSIVLDLRRKKSMVIDPHDPNTRSAGSFFLNPVISEEEYADINKRWKESGNTNDVPHYAAGKQVKVPAAWLIEQSGFTKGFRKGGVGISAHHSLALINVQGSTAELLELAAEIQNSVRRSFGISLAIEPVLIK